MKRLLMIGAAVAALAIAVVLVGGAVTSAQQGDGPVGTFISKLAGKLGISEEQLRTAVKDTQTEMIDEQLASGTITQAQADRLKERAQSGKMFVPGSGRGGRRFGGRAIQFTVDATAKIVNLDASQVKDQLKGGKSLAEIAQTQGMSVDDFKAKLSDEVHAGLNAKVGDNTLTQTQADSLFQKFTDNIDQIVNFHVGQGGSFGHGFRGWRDQGDKSTPEPSPEASPQA